MCSERLPLDSTRQMLKTLRYIWEGPSPDFPAMDLSEFTSRAVQFNVHHRVS